jgi:hypothetical protein
MEESDMTAQRTCDCCKQSAQIINKDGLCFACNTFQTFAAIIKEQTDLADEETLNLAGDLQESILSEIIDRLQMSGHDDPLAAELLQTMEPRTLPH